MYYKRTIMQEGKKPISQADRLAKQLRSLRPDVTSDDRKLLQEEMGYTRATISKYLSGQVLNNDTAAKIIAFFKNRIASREKVITQ